MLDGEDSYVEVPNANDAWAFGDDDFTIAAYVLMDQRGADRRYNIMGYTTALLDAVFWDGWWFRLRHCCAGEQLYFHFCIGCGGGGGGGTDMGPQVPGAISIWSGIITRWDVAEIKCGCSMTEN